MPEEIGTVGVFGEDEAFAKAGPNGVNLRRIPGEMTDQQKKSMA